MVTDSATGLGIPDVAVSVLDQASNIVGQTTTAADGSYSIAGLAPGQDLIQFSAFFYNGTASKLTVSASVVRTINVALTQLQPTGSLSGNVTGSSGALAGVLVTVLDQSNNVVATAQTDGSGNYSINGLVVATYSVTFSVTGYQTDTVTGVVITAGIPPMLNAVLTPTANPMDATVTITVTSGGSPAVGATVTLDYGPFNPGGAPMIAQTDATGQVQFSNQLVGVPCTISVTLSDGLTSFPVQTSTFQSGSSAPANNLTFSN
jgi:hypothetical protein